MSKGSYKRMAKQSKACHINTKKGPIYKPKGCTIKHGVHVNGKFITSKGKVQKHYSSKPKPKPKPKSTPTPATPTRSASMLMDRRVAPDVGSATSTPKKATRRIMPQAISTASQDVLSPNFGRAPANSSSSMSSAPSVNHSRENIEALIRVYEQRHREGTLEQGFDELMDDDDRAALRKGKKKTKRNLGF